MMTSATALAWDPSDPDTRLECELWQGREVQRWSGTMREQEQLFEFQHTMEKIDTVEAVLAAMGSGSIPECCVSCHPTDVVCLWTCSNEPPCPDSGECPNGDRDCYAGTHCVAGHCVPVPACPCGLQYNEQGEASCLPCHPPGPGLWTWFADMFDFSIEWPWED